VEISIELNLRSLEKDALYLGNFHENRGGWTERLDSVKCRSRNAKFYQNRTINLEKYG